MLFPVSDSDVHGAHCLFIETSAVCQKYGSDYSLTGKTWITIRFLRRYCVCKKANFISTSYSWAHKNRQSKFAVELNWISICLAQQLKRWSLQRSLFLKVQHYPTFHLRFQSTADLWASTTVEKILRTRNSRAGSKNYCTFYLQYSESSTSHCFQSHNFTCHGELQYFSRIGSKQLVLRKRLPCFALS